MIPQEAADSANVTALLWVEMVFYSAYFLGLAFFLTFQRMKHLRWELQAAKEDFRWQLKWSEDQFRHDIRMLRTELDALRRKQRPPEGAQS